MFLWHRPMCDVTPRLGSYHNQTIVRVLYGGTAFLCVFMVMWIAVFPSSWLMGRSSLHDRLVDKYIVAPYDGSHVPPATITKYAGHTAVQFGHILPGAFWAGAIPFQLHPDMRLRFGAVHRFIGYVFVLFCLVQAFGVFVILKRDLTFDRDYVGLPPIEGFEKRALHASMILQTAWFVFTALAAVRSARERNMKSHRRYVLRHVASGIWVALQRVLISLYRPRTSSQMRDMFGYASFAAVSISSLCAELAIRILERPKTKQ